MHENASPEAVGFVIDPAEEAPENECRDGLPGVEVDQREDECRPEDGLDGTLLLDQDASHHVAAAEEFLAQGGEDGSRDDQVDRFRRIECFSEGFLYEIRHLQP